MTFDEKSNTKRVYLSKIDKRSSPPLPLTGEDYRAWPKKPRKFSTVQIRFVALHRRDSGWLVRRSGAHPLAPLICERASPA